MLGKTANGLFWMYRYLERAENTARLIETGQRLALTRLSDPDAEWRPVLQSATQLGPYLAANETVTRDGAIDWLLRSRDNPTSVLACIGAARQNARMVRTALTADVWEAVNATYIHAGEVLARKVGERDLPGVLRGLRQRTALVRGMTQGTMMRDEIYDFARLGSFIERADNTARILDVKYYVLLPSAQAVGSSIDNVQWESILRSLSAKGGFRMQYGSRVAPARSRISSSSTSGCRAASPSAPATSGPPSAISPAATSPRAVAADGVADRTAVPVPRGRRDLRLRPARDDLGPADQLLRSRAADRGGVPIP